ncbi:ethanolamine ammonia-lyase subunit EutC [Pedobacter sp. MC2016-14]|uniref:ethanolamine ammonia-lyase subunit EutC n=1 Tax=Pedobacter sp. MC2016-14 TaxID=2897327 RepID=UPI001E463933|nr:ethanolamine ammonia-lyase subunit EutC [Pedobacter sp. MC2016-14]MCD0489603.1 ethanolamine ammonia-lyase subunit EutC [Pedobacter sp. MC2016-14]
MAKLALLKKFTDARIALGRAGTSIPAKASLEFKLAHAHARDAVYSSIQPDQFAKALSKFNLPILLLHSGAADRAQYLQRPDLGRQLDGQSAEILKNQVTGADVVLVLADGLSALALQENIIPLLSRLLPKLISSGLSLAPLCIVEQGRVAIADEIAEALEAKLSLILIGERPGLSSADSLGAYLTYQPKKGLTDDSRNCISNIRPAGLDFDLAAGKIFYLVQESFRLKISGVQLKDNQGLLS